MLTEGDDQQDPIADAARAILDGHIVLSRRIAESGQYPAIDVEASISRVMHDIVPATSCSRRGSSSSCCPPYEHNRDLVAIGAYRAGFDPRVDAAIAAQPRHSRNSSARTCMSASASTDSVQQLDQLIGEPA